MKLPVRAERRRTLSQRLGRFVLGRIRQAYYRMAESTTGSHKRDFLVARVEDARTGLEETKEQLQTTLERFSALIAYDGGSLASYYRALKREFDHSEQKAEEVRNHIDTIESLAESLFSEWEDELALYTNRSLRSKSRQKLRLTQRHYKQLIGAMRKAESRIDPVLNAFRDQVLFLKHNLNARAIAALQHELNHVSVDIAAMIQVMEQSIQQADRFIRTLEEPKELPKP
ncbi:hypothetical protein MIT9_P1463 [Methylomarinovum caldicuralii]|uniref:DUF2959 domain-containing protein n=1 Tax=Methylomarinovum caldicuralii TaxID=438856 RepID=A0AAU9BTE1_9GAMM|nr:DUF2959 domain-containing protein [Methylomarinovum caldicuralii]BCX81881.1 hypothetical protein MIT9_P1463 [Methylomarinovum caldicuralii]